MKYLLCIIAFLLFSSKIGYSQELQKPETKKYIFDPNANAANDLSEAIKEATKVNKNILLVVGGDWNFWSRKLHTDFTVYGILRQVIEPNYVYFRINYSPNNKNEEILNSLGCPKDIGYPVVMILDKRGVKLHAQNVDEFKGGKNYYNSSKIADFLLKWRRIPPTEEENMKKNKI